MRKKRLAGAIVAAMLVVGLLPAAAQAAKPLDVDCDLMKATGDFLDDLFDQEEVGPTNLGQSLKVLNANWDDVGPLISNISYVLSGGTDRIDLESAIQANTTAAKCGLVKFSIDNIRD
jgi:hypothetical protein